jgi:hypothetical protein
MIEMDCVKGELRHEFEIGETDNECVFYVKSYKASFREMQSHLTGVLTGHYGLFFDILGSKQTKDYVIYKISVFI